MNDKSLCIGFNNLHFDSGDISEPLGMVSDNFALLGTTLSKTTEETKDLNRTFTFSINLKLRLLRLLGLISGRKHNPLRAREIMRFIRHNQL